MVGSKFRSLSYFIHSNRFGGHKNWAKYFWSCTQLYGYSSQNFFSDHVIYAIFPLSHSYVTVAYMHDMILHVLRVIVWQRYLPDVRIDNCHSMCVL